MPGAGFRNRPFMSHGEIDSGHRVPAMEGKAVFKEAVTRMPDAVRRPGQLICFTALGSGLHWGALLYRTL